MGRVLNSILVLIKLYFRKHRYNIPPHGIAIKVLNKINTHLVSSITNM